MFSGRGIQLVQRKKTIYPEWNTCFDAHLYEGRVVQMVAMERPNRFLADVTVSAKALADKCTDSNIATVWVRDSSVLTIEVVVVDVLGFLTSHQ